MKKLMVALLLIGACASVDAQKWTSMFNGKNIKGWQKKGGTAEYKVENGELVGISTLAAKENTFLTNGKMYGDFILEFDFMVDDRLNSGVQFRSISSPDIKKGRVHGYQFEIDPTNRAWSGGIYDEARRGWIYSGADNPAGQKAFKNNEWNKARVEAIGTSIRTWVNGTPVANLEDAETATGIIAFQVHSINKKEQDGTTVRWRDIRIYNKKDVSKYATPTTSAPLVTTFPNKLGDNEIKEGWKLLWDGTTTNGWRSARQPGFPQKGWVIADGVLQVLRSDGGESTNGGDIITEKKYKNFELMVDFKITEGANSGIKYFVDPELNKGPGSSIGCEFQILDDARHPDAKLGVNGNRTLGSLYDLIPAPDNKPVNKFEWNTARIIINGNHVEHWLNGKKIIEYDRNNQMFNALVAYSKYAQWPNFGNLAEGHILLQDHGDNVFFRNIKIKELP